MVEVDEDGARSGAVAAVDVTPAITDHPGPAQVEPQCRRGIQQHPGLRFTAERRFALPGITTDFDARDLGDQSLQFGMDGFNHNLALRAAAHIRLVGGHDQDKPGLMQCPAGGRYIFVQLELGQG